mgnify:CR=1 FL=1
MSQDLSEIAPAQGEAGTVDFPIKCGAVGCKLPNSDIVTCNNEGCTKKVHMSCYKRAVLERHGADPLIDPVKECGLIVCSKTCYNKVEKAIVNQPTRLPWDKDGKYGPDDPNNSMNILLNWLLEEGNYSRFRGKDNGGKRKLAYGLQLSQKFSSAGCRVARSAEAVVKQIQEIEKYVY